MTYHLITWITEHWLECLHSMINFGTTKSINWMNEQMNMNEWMNEWMNESADLVFPFLIIIV